jgi:hypothetical protein
MIVNSALSFAESLALRYGNECGQLSLHPAARYAHYGMAAAQRVASNPAVQDVAADAAVGAGGELVQAAATGQNPDVVKGAAAGVISNGMYRATTGPIANNYGLSALLQKSFQASAANGVATFATEGVSNLLSGKPVDGNVLGQSIAASYIGPIGPVAGRVTRALGLNKTSQSLASEAATRLPAVIDHHLRQPRRNTHTSSGGGAANAQ